MYIIQNENPILFFRWCCCNNNKKNRTRLLSVYVLCPIIQQLFCSHFVPLLSMCCWFGLGFFSFDFHWLIFFPAQPSIAVFCWFLFMRVCLCVSVYLLLFLSGFFSFCLLFRCIYLRTNGAKKIWYWNSTIKR